jgi:hypothetical protein
MYAVTLKITNGRGNEERQTVTIGKNFEAANNRGEAYFAAIEYARNLGLGVLLDDPDVRISCDSYLGTGIFS